VNTDLELHELLSLERKNKAMSSSLMSNNLDPDDLNIDHFNRIKNNDHQTKFYTGLPNWSFCLFSELRASRITLWCGAKTSSKTVIYV